jgi:cbb3-type cytochrome oxidase subunit 1
VLFLVGMLIMLYNVIKTISAPQPQVEAVPVPAV